MIEIKFTFNTIPEALSALEALATVGVRPEKVVDVISKSSREAVAKYASGDTAPPKSTSAATPTAQAPATVAPVKSETSASSPSEAVTYEVLKKAVFTLAAKDKQSAIDLCAKMGVKTFKDLPEARWGEALDAVNAAMGKA